MIIKSIEELKKASNNNKLGNFVVIHGNQKEKIKTSEEYIKNLVTSFKELNLIEIGGNNITIDSIKNACETVPLMDERKIVYINTPSFLLDNVDIINKNLLKDILEYANNIPPYTILLICHFDIIDKSNTILKFANNIGTLIEYKIPSYGKELNIFIEEFLKANRKNISKSDIFYLSSILSGATNSLERELQKLVGFIGEKNLVERKDIDAIIYKSPESNVFKLTDYMFKKNVTGAIEIVDTLVLQGEAYSKILFMIIRQFRIFYKLKLMIIEKFEPKEIMKELKLQEFAYKGMVKVITYWKEEDIRLILEEALKTDYNIKSGKIEPSIALEMLIFKACKK